MDMNFLLGAATTWMFTTEQGRETFKKAANITGAIANGFAQKGIEQLKAAAPEVAEIVTNSLDPSAKA